MAALLALLLAGCAAAPVSWPVPTQAAVAVKTPDPDAVLRLPVPPGDPPDPLHTRSRQWNGLYRLIYESGVQLSETGEPMPGLCESWESSPDGLTWRFTLRKNAVFHDGTPVTADQVVASLRDAADESRGEGLYSEPMRHVVRYEVNGPYALSVILDEPGMYALYALCCPVLRGTDEALPCGTGPYMLAPDATKNRLTLVRNQEYAQRPPAIASIMTVPCADEESALANLSLGQVSVAPVFSALSASAAGLTRASSLQISTHQYEFLAPNLRQGFTADLAVRQAIAQAVDVSELLRSVYQGRAVMAETPVRPDSYLFDIKTPTFAFNPDAARKTLEDAGYVDIDGDGVREAPAGAYDAPGVRRRLSLRLLADTGDETSQRREVATIIVDMLKAVGMDVTLVTAPVGDVATSLQSGAFDLTLINVQLSEIPNLQPLLGSGGERNVMGAHDQELDDILERANRSCTTQELQSAYRQLQRHIADQLPLIGLYFHTGALYYRPQLQGISFSRDTQLYMGVTGWSMQ